ncbi:SNF2 family N-terminal domain-containing protein [Phlyctochytrium arcticum]|nr:SNF2 family N-terminal domain-containing protein [Phlyctochytrium arcticum]
MAKEQLLAIGVLGVPSNTILAACLEPTPPANHQENSDSRHWIPCFTQPKRNTPSKDCSLWEALQFICASGIASAFVYDTAKDSPIRECSSNSESRTPQYTFFRVFVRPSDREGWRIMAKMGVAKSRLCRKMILLVLQNVVVDNSVWTVPTYAEYERQRPSRGLFVYKPSDIGLSALYQAMPSPAPVSFDPQTSSPNLTPSLLNECLTLPIIPGMRTALFNYQRNTLWKLLQRELCPQRVLDPDLVCCHTADSGSGYWIRLGTGDIYQDPIFYEEVRGGIICEDMGTGKTCICIALILKTRDQISEPPVDCVDGKLFLQRSKEWLHAVRDLEPDLIDIMPDSHPHSLRELAASTILTTGIPYRDYKTHLPRPIYKFLKHSWTYYLKCPPQTVRQGRKTSEKAIVPSRRIYLSSTTLCVVPDTLVNQWQTELIKHVHDRVVKLIVITNPKDQVPPAEKLLLADMVLISHQRFGLEYGRDGGTFGLASGHSSPLCDIRWMRLIVDEGHSMARKSEASSQVAMAALLKCDRRWVCTGTPMPNAFKMDDAEDGLVYSQAEDTKDLQKLGSLLADFLKIEPYASNKDLFRNIIVKPFLDRQFRGFEKLRDLMSRVMIRNRQVDIERDIKLPPLYERQVLLDFGPVQRITHNCLLSAIGANAILSEREHQDYFFHPSQGKALREVIQNLFASTFWYAPSSLIPLVISTLQNVRNGLVDRSFSDQDLNQLLDIERVLVEAQEFGLWTRIVQQEELVYGAVGVPETISQPFISESDASFLQGAAIYQGQQLEHLVAALKKARLEPPPTAQEEGVGIAGPTPPADIIPHPMIISTSSTKLSYLADQLLLHSPHEKIIVYAQGYNEIHYVHELCRLAKIRCILFHRQQKVSERAGSVTTFNTSENAPVIIMDVKLAAWGIDLSSASRVYFLSPVWGRDVERQAVKRAHRIGCTKPVYVETLVVRGTFEEEMMSRRQEMGSMQPSSKVTDDGKMRAVLSRATLVPAEKSTEFPLQPLMYPVKMQDKEWSDYYEKSESRTITEEPSKKRQSNNDDDAGDSHSPPRRVKFL